jgi:hypothetical protein
MEKLDKPYKRGGKTITHRVVCGKVRKMRGGHPNINNYIKKLDLIRKFNKDLFVMLGYGKYQKYILGIISEYCYHIIPIFSNISDSFEERRLLERRLTLFEEKFKELIKDKKERIEDIYKEVVSELKNYDSNPLHKIFKEFNISSLDEELKAFIEYLLDKINHLMLEKDTKRTYPNFVYYYDEIYACIKAHKSRIDCIIKHLPKILLPELIDELQREVFKKNSTLVIFNFYHFLISCFYPRIRLRV